MSNCKIIAISGGSGSGKTAIAMLLKEMLGKNTDLISQDSYYNDLSHLSTSARAKTNFDHPDSIDFSQLQQCLKNLKSGLNAEIPEYCFKTHTRNKSKTTLSAKSIVIVEGIYSYFNEEIKKLVDFTIYIDADSDIRLIRRIKRDTLERGRSIESIISQYETNVRTMHIEHVSQQKTSADLVIHNNGNITLHDIVNTLAIDISKRLSI